MSKRAIDEGGRTEIRSEFAESSESSKTEESHSEIHQRHEDLTRFHTLLQHIRDAIFVLDLDDGTVVDAVGNTAGIVGRAQSDVIGAHVSEMLTEDMHAALCEAMAALGPITRPDA